METRETKQKELAALLMAGCDGGNGEFDPYIPAALRRPGLNVMPNLYPNGAVRWIPVIHGPRRGK